ncbi:class II fructose-bisphosphatase [Alicyclobacillus tolerans]|uniref:class II fructose-bisphosphatase n=1 Tax=Alicyclobacillus tolerans TaxID=90970 RepID=UPI001F008C31|nr:class II fructose-bisphosphatase [Alicyclobacillus tolerans]MCF8566506.1 class II fructose-bisphosphatase [Alicyclobacillus tolerans]
MTIETGAGKNTSGLRTLTLEIARVTEAAAIAASRWMGKGDKWSADNAATQVMRSVLARMDVRGTVVIGEGEMDEAPMLYIGEQVGTGLGEAVDIAVDPLEGTNILAKGSSDSITILAMAPRGALLHAPDMYMDKIAVGPKAKGKVHLDASVKENVTAVARAVGKPVEDVVVVLLDRPRHDDIVEQIRSIGARVKLITDGDVSPSLSTCEEDSGIDMVLGRGGAPEGVITAVAMKCMGGDFQGRLVPQNDEEIARCASMGLTQPLKTLLLDDIVQSDDAIFSATGVTGGELLRGVRFLAHDVAVTHSVVGRALNGTVRHVTGRHHLSRKPYS